MAEEEGFRLAGEVHLRGIGGAHHQARVAKEDPRVVGSALVGGMEVEDSHIAVE